jgi:hypothetical protein
VGVAGRKRALHVPLHAAGCGAEMVQCGRAGRVPPPLGQTRPLDPKLLGGGGYPGGAGSERYETHAVHEQFYKYTSVI